MSKSSLTRDETFQIALKAAEILIRNGGEIVRTEETIQRICYSRGYDEASPFVTPSVIIIGTTHAEGPSYILNIKKRGNDLNRIVMVNDFSRQFVSTRMSYEKAMKRLEEIEKGVGYPLPLMALGGAIGSSAFSLLIGGTMQDIIPCLITSFIAVMCMFKIDRWSFPVLNNLLLGILIATLGSIFTAIGFGSNRDQIIIGAMLPLLPGIPFTNGVRDFMYGDLISGTSRIVEAVIIIVALSFGVGIVMNIMQAVMGGAL